MVGFLTLLSVLGVAVGAAVPSDPYAALTVLKQSCRDTNTCPLVYSEESLRARLTPEQYHVTREKGTERSCHVFYVLYVSHIIIANYCSHQKVIKQVTPYV